MQVKLPKGPRDPGVLPMYSVVRHTDGGITLPGRPTQIGFWARGNSGWQRVIPALTDTSGQRWIFVGGLNSGDTATIAEWLFEEGEHFDEGDILVEAVSEAGTVEVRSPAAGVLVEWLVEEGETVRTGDPLAVIETDEDLPDFHEE